MDTFSSRTLIATVLLITCFKFDISVADKNGNASEILNTEQRLIGDLLANYSSTLRPLTGSPKKPIEVKYGMSLVNLIGFDESEETLILNVWLRKQWPDWRLQWDPAEYGGITSLRIPAEKLWKPDIVPYNSKHKDAYEYVYGDLAVVFSSGEVLWVPHHRLHTHCSMDMTRFPFDKQTCTIVFGSWTYTGFDVDVQFYEAHRSMDLTDYRQSGEWDIIDADGERFVKKYPCCEEPFISLEFNITMARKAAYYVNEYVVPAVFMALLVPSVFLLPPASPHKFILGTGLIICQALLSDKLSERLPNGFGTTPIIERYYVFCLFTIALSLALSALLTTIKSGLCSCLQEPPRCLKMIADLSFLRILCIPGNSDEEPYLNMTSVDARPSVDQSASTDAQAIVTPSSSPKLNEWYMLVAILDRVLFCLFLLVIIIVTAVMLLPG